MLNIRHSIQSTPILFEITRITKWRTDMALLPIEVNTVYLHSKVLLCMLEELKHKINHITSHNMT